ncbi:DegT/DnrJ/EryC1/StrS family aminotransferase [Longimicrobium sp.]|uniref:DegT/DnrJ/EryC1/StrS family aminotransferase n=1 Tax=Longimicrobium sp. TaxID=2029185 RepID=UPI003B3AF154
MIPRLKPLLGARELVAALSPWRGGIAEFEAAFAAEMGQRHAVAFPYGRTGLALLLEALELRGARVLCPAYTCVVVPHAVVKSGNEPAFVDSRDDDFNMDLELAARALERGGAGALVATSIFGYPVDLDRLDDLRERYPRMRVVQDCAHSFAAEWKGRPVQREGDAAIFGLNISKLMTSVFGGMVTTDSPALAQRLRALRAERVRPAAWSKSLRRFAYLAAVYPAFQPAVYGMVNRLERSGVLDRFVKYYDEGVIAMPADYLDGMTALEGRVGAVQVARYRELVERRRRIAALYDAALAGTPGLRLPPRVPGATYSHYVPRVDDRARVLEGARRRGVQLGQLIEYCIPHMPAYRDRDGAAAAADFPVAARLSETTINLPLAITPREAERTAAVVREVMAA